MARDHGKRNVATSCQRKMEPGGPSMTLQADRMQVGVQGEVQCRRLFQQLQGPIDGQRLHANPRDRLR